jgi:hypothetical protein
MSAPASSMSAVVPGITCCCSKVQHRTRAATADAICSRASWLNTRSTSPSTTCQPREPTLHALYGARSRLVWLIRPDGHLAYSGVPENLDQLRTYLDRIYIRQAAASDRTDGGSERN